ncbi:putative tetratricopeptide-like helical domain superfamily [Plasmopara halstedii]
MQGVDDQPAVASFPLPASPARNSTGYNNISIDSEHSDANYCVPEDALDFPLVQWENSSTPTSHSDISCTSSSLVPFQKLQLDTNLNDTTLPYPRSRTSSMGSLGSSCNGSESPGRRKPPTPTQQLASGFLGMETESTSQLSQEFMNALRLQDFTHEKEPQLSVRLRGSRVELASASEKHHVDFLGPAENIKRLFKLPYSQSRVSLAVHRVGSTLVVDGELNESDLPIGFEHLQQDTVQLAQQTEEMTQTLLYEKFIYESTVTPLPPSETATIKRKEEKERIGGNVTLTEKHKKSRRSKKGKRKVASLKSQSEQSELLPADEIKKDQGSDTQKFGSSSSQNASSPSFIPTETNWFTSAQHTPSFNNDSQTFQRILRWKFNDLKMILGSQVLLFSNQEHPAVSLKLHDMDNELSLCTLLDYYLDNVIANIPELAICMHSKGLVRGYKLVETGKIPYMSGTGRPLFDVQDVSLNASMLLKFLQENCSRPNGTYWLHRKEGESSLRLYDVDMLSQGSQLKWKYMMAMLCYRFAARASRLINSLAAGTPQLQQQLHQRQRELLRTCMSLLGEIAEKGGTAHSSICSSVSEQLADTYLRECSQFHPLTATDSVAADWEAAINSLKMAKEYLHASIKLLEECISQDSISILTHSESCLYDDTVVDGDSELAEDDGEGEVGDFMHEELDRLRLKFSSACLELGQLHVGSRKWLEAVDNIVEASQFITLSSIPEGIQPLDLASPDQEGMVNSLLDKLDFDGVRRGGSSRNTVPFCKSSSELRGSLLNLIGDMAAQRPVDVYQELNVLHEIISGVKRNRFFDLCNSTQDFLKLVENEEMSSDSKTVSEKEEALMVLSFFSYLRALSPPVDSELYFSMMKKLGNASNELGKYHLAMKQNYMEAFRWFERGCKIFSNIEDGVNVALLRANLAHLHKIFAQDKPTHLREDHYCTAIQLCTDALQLLKQSKADGNLCKNVKGELALTYLVWAVHLANCTFTGMSNGLTSTPKRENETLTLFNQALSLYSELGDQKQIASTHYQIASFYSRIITSTLRDESESPSCEKSDGPSSSMANRMEIARRHYEKALSYFGSVEVGKIFVLIHQELADLYLLGGRVEGIEHALLILLSTYEAFNRTQFRNLTSEKEEMASLACDIVEKVKCVLHQLIRLSTSGRTNGETKSKKLEMFKKMYKEVIYYDGISAESILPILDTLRGLYTV